jgi:ABC-type Fe3+/spermidine/putrescine transport system ATPase subunit
MSDRIAVMRSGHVEQCAEPKVIYEQPATAFVANFVGTTNLLRGMVVARSGNDVEVNAGETRIKADAHGAAAAVGQGVVLSLRPEALRLVNPGETSPAGWSTLTGSLGELEYLGALTRFQVKVADGTVLQLMSLVPPQADTQVTVACDPSRVVVLPEDK